MGDRKHEDRLSSVRNDWTWRDVFHFKRRKNLANATLMLNVESFKNTKADLCFSVIRGTFVYFYLTDDI